jgi:hypothetical protein
MTQLFHLGVSEDDRNNAYFACAAYRTKAGEPSGRLVS